MRCRLYVADRRRAPHLPFNNQPSPTRPLPCRPCGSNGAPDPAQKEQPPTVQAEPAVEAQQAPSRGLKLSEVLARTVPAAQQLVCHAVAVHQQKGQLRAQMRDIDRQLAQAKVPSAKQLVAVVQQHQLCREEPVLPLPAMPTPLPTDAPTPATPAGAATAAGTTGESAAGEEQPLEAETVMKDAVATASKGKEAQPAAAAPSAAQHQAEVPSAGPDAAANATSPPAPEEAGTNGKAAADPKEAAAELARASAASQ